MRKEGYTDETMGVVVAIRNKGLDFPTVIDVEYSVNGKRYIVRENLKLRSIHVKVGIMPIG